jgi:hypothetical protein
MTEGEHFWCLWNLKMTDILIAKSIYKYTLRRLLNSTWQPWPSQEACQRGKLQRGLMTCQWRWERLMCLGATDASGSDASDGHLVVSNSTDA